MELNFEPTHIAVCAGINVMFQLLTEHIVRRLSDAIIRLHFLVQASKLTDRLLINEVKCCFGFIATDYIALRLIVILTNDIHGAYLLVLLLLSPATMSPPAKFLFWETFDSR
ncbi:hypothetical protein WS87_08415 [Burkholderia sp. MSMB0856]|nr:hypothetical protein WS87_08415 [Burkholderia sp. MSMB0856]KVH38033.1 hypothetical protein WS87_00025 [Burkholderia sp. MSMB0856]